MKIGDAVCCIQELPYTYKDEKKFVKIGHRLIITRIIGDQFVLERFNKFFIVHKEIVRSYPMPIKLITELNKNISK